MSKAAVVADLAFTIDSSGGASGAKRITGQVRGDDGRLTVTTEDPAGLIAALRADLGAGEGPLAAIRRLRSYAAVLAGQGLILSIDGVRGTIVELGNVGHRSAPFPFGFRRNIRFGRISEGYPSLLLKSVLSFLSPPTGSVKSRAV